MKWTKEERDDHLRSIASQGGKAGWAKQNLTKEQMSTEMSRRRRLGEERMREEHFKKVERRRQVESS